MTDLLPILRAPELMVRCGLDPDLKELRSMAGLDSRVFDVLIKSTFHEFAEAVQLAPASENHHHAGPGGLIKHTLDVISIALYKRRGYQLPLGGSLESIAQERHLWTYAVYVACLLHDIGKLSSRIRLVLHMADDTERVFTPQYGPIFSHEDARGYRIRFEDTPYAYHQKLALCHWHILPKTARAWLMQSPLIMSQLTAYLWGDRFESGIIGEIAEFADGQSVAKNLQLPEPRFSSAIAPVERYIRYIRNWIAEGAVRINVNGAMIWVDGEGYCYAVCRPLAEKLIQACADQRLAGMPQDPVRIYDILQEHGYALPTPQGKAIWTIRVQGEGFQHELTCLKFEARRLTTPRTLLKPFPGSVQVIDGSCSDASSIAQTRGKIGTESEAPPSNGGEEAVYREDTVATPQETNTQDSESMATMETGAGSEDTAATSPVLHSSASRAEACSLSTPTPKIESSGAAAPSLATDPIQEAAPGAVASTQETAALNAPAPPNADQPRPRQAAHFELSSPEAGRSFLRWLKNGLVEKTMRINDVDTDIHIVEEGVFLLAPAIFKRFLDQHGFDGDKHHRNLSTKFCRLRLHLRNGDVNIHNYWVHGKSRKSQIKGWILPFDAVFEHGYPIPPRNKFITKHLTEVQETRRD